MSATRRLVVAGDPSEDGSPWDDRARPVAVELATTQVHEMFEMDSRGVPIGWNSEWHHDPEADGAIFRIVTLRPTDPNAEKPLHASPTVDVGVVLSGSVELRLPASETSTLNAGDSFVLRGVEHAWVNAGPHDCELAVVLMRPSRLVQEIGSK